MRSSYHGPSGLSMSRLSRPTSRISIESNPPSPLVPTRQAPWSNRIDLRDGSPSGLSGLPAIPASTESQAPRGLFDVDVESESLSLDEIANGCKLSDNHISEAPKITAFRQLSPVLEPVRSNSPSIGNSSDSHFALPSTPPDPPKKERTTALKSRTDDGVSRLAHGRKPSLSGGKKKEEGVDAPRLARFLSRLSTSKT